MPKCHATNILSEKLALRNIAPEYPKEIFNKHFPTCFFFGSATLHIEGLPAQLAGRPFSAASRLVGHTNPAFLALKGGERALKGHETGSERKDAGIRHESNDKYRGYCCTDGQTAGFMSSQNLLAGPSRGEYCTNGKVLSMLL